MANFDLLNDFSVNLKLPLDIFDDQCNLLGVYYSRPTYAKLVKRFEKLRDEIEKLQGNKKGQD